MPRSEYLNFRITKANEPQIRVICADLGIDPDDRGSYTQAINFALMFTISQKGQAAMNTRTIEKWDRVLIDGETPGEVVQDGGMRSLVSTQRSDGEEGEQRDWYDNSRLHVRQRRKEKALGDEPPEVELY